MVTIEGFMPGPEEPDEPERRSNGVRNKLSRVFKPVTDVFLGLSDIRNENGAGLDRFSSRLEFRTLRKVRQGELQEAGEVFLRGSESGNGSLQDVALQRAVTIFQSLETLRQRGQKPKNKR